MELEECFGHLFGDSECDCINCIDEQINLDTVDDDKLKFSTASFIVNSETLSQESNAPIIILLSLILLTLLVGMFCFGKWIRGQSSRIEDIEKQLTVNSPRKLKRSGENISRFPQKKQRTG